MRKISRSQREVVLVGGGHAHVQVLESLAMNPLVAARLTVVLDVPVAVYSGMVPGFVAGQYHAHELEIDVVPLARRAGARVILSPATGVDTERKRILLADRPSIPYDVASFDIGSTVAGLDLPGVLDYALPTRPIGRFVQRADELTEMAAEAESDESFRVAVIGAGAGGVELAFSLEERLRRTGVRPCVTLVHGGRSILPGYPRSLARRVERCAAARSIEFLLDSRVTAVEPGVARLENGTPVSFDALVWVTGAVGHDLFRASGLPLDERGFVRTRSTLQVEGHDDLFAVGDCGTLIDFPLTPKAGVYAVRQGPHVGENIRRRIAGKPLQTYTPQRDFLTLLNMGDGSALGSKWGLSFHGRWVMRWKDSIDRRFMRRFQILEPDGRLTAAFRDGPKMSHEMEDAPCGGCAAKLGQEPLARALAEVGRLPTGIGENAEPVVELGLSAPDDAAVWHAAMGARIGSSVDLFSAFTDDPYLVGRIAAVNALSDLWATGIDPRVAHAIVAIPENLGAATAGETLFQLLAGARTAFDSLGVALAGGHTTAGGDRLLVGFAVEGELEQSRQPMRKGGLRPGDALVLTKALGTGVILRADMGGQARGPWLSATVGSMLRPNRDAARIAVDHGASGMTDVTGFGLSGHLSEMLAAGGVTARLDLTSLPALPGAVELLGQGVRSTFHPQNSAIRHRVEAESAAEGHPNLELLFDPQTSGGLLFGISVSDASRVVELLRESGDRSAAVIGRVTPPRAGVVRMVVTASTIHQS